MSTPRLFKDTNTARLNNQNNTPLTEYHVNTPKRYWSAAMTFLKLCAVCAPISGTGRKYFIERK